MAQWLKHLVYIWEPWKGLGSNHTAVAFLSQLHQLFTLTNLEIWLPNEALCYVR